MANLKENVSTNHVDQILAEYCVWEYSPSIKLETFVATYIHNVSLFQVPRDYSISWKIKSILKRLYINYQSPNTDVWIVQTDNTQNIIRKYLNTHKPILIYPFFIFRHQLILPFLIPEEIIFLSENTLMQRGMNILLRLGSNCQNCNWIIPQSSILRLHLPVCSH